MQKHRQYVDEQTLERESTSSGKQLLILVVIIITNGTAS